MKYFLIRRFSSQNFLQRDHSASVMNSIRCTLNQSNLYRTQREAVKYFGWKNAVDLINRLITSWHPYFYMKSIFSQRAFNLV